MARLINESLGFYESVVRGVESDATSQNARTYGGMVRAKKGKLVEKIAANLLRAAWIYGGGEEKRLAFNVHPKYDIPAKPE